MKTKLLIVDDETDILEMLTSFFEGKWYEVLTAADGAAALSALSRGPDLILLDINLPDLDGLEICRRIRSHVSCPILFLTARIEDTDKVKGLMAGGDDYILKPFSLSELEARVFAHLRRETRRQISPRLKCADGLIIDYAQRTVSLGEETVSFAKKEFDIIELLSENAGQIFDRERIYERIWGYDSEGDSSVVAEHIRRIRARLAVLTDRPCIETVWGCGYKWIA